MPAPISHGSPSGPGPRPPSDLGRYAGLGLQFAFTMALLGGLGYWADTAFGTLPWLLVTGILVGAIGGFVRIVRAVPRSLSFTPKHAPLAHEQPDADPFAEPRDGSERSRASQTAARKERAE